VASQVLTIAKIGGDAADATLSWFGKWRDARLVDSPNEWSPEQWPADVRLQADAWAVGLRQHGRHPPVLFFVEYVDLWSFSPPERHIGNDSMIQVVANTYELYCLPLPVDEAISKSLRRLSAKGQWDEDKLFGMLAGAAVSAWNKVVDKAVVVFLRETYRGSVEDWEVKESLLSVPSWLNRPQGYSTS